MSKRIYNTLRGSGEPTKARAIQTAAIRRRMKKLKEAGLTSDEIGRIEQAAYTKMYRELGILGTKESSDSDTNSHDKRRIRTMLWP